MKKTAPSNMRFGQRIVGLTVLFMIIMCFMYFFLSPEISDQKNSEYRYLHSHKSTSDMINVNELKHFGECLLKQAGERIVQIRGEHQEAEFAQRKKDKSVVTVADLESHEILIHTLNYKFPALRIISEEKSSKNNDSNEEMQRIRRYYKLCNNYIAHKDDVIVPASRLNVWIDPLDATQEYSENLVEYVSVMLCIVIDGQPRAGVIHKPFSNTTVSSMYTDDKRIEFRNPGTKKPRIIVSRSHAGQVKSVIQDKLKDFSIITAAGAGYKTLSLLENKADLYLHTTRIFKWDLCAANAILSNLGGKMTSLTGKPIDFSYNEEEFAIKGVLASVYNHAFYLNIFENTNE